MPYFGVLIIRILLFRVLYWGPLFLETPTLRSRNPSPSNLGIGFLVVGLGLLLSRALYPKPTPENLTCYSIGPPYQGLGVSGLGLRVVRTGAPVSRSCRFLDTRSSH